MEERFAVLCPRKGGPAASHMKKAGRLSLTADRLMKNLTLPYPMFQYGTF